MSCFSISSPTSRRRSQSMYRNVLRRQASYTASRFIRRSWRPDSLRRVTARPRLANYVGHNEDKTMDDMSCNGLSRRGFIGGFADDGEGTVATHGRTRIPAAPLSMICRAKTLSSRRHGGMPPYHRSRRPAIAPFNLSTFRLPAFCASCRAAGASPGRGTRPRARACALAPRTRARTPAPGPP